MARRTQAQMAETRANLLTTAREHFSWLGYAETSMDEIAASVNLTRVYSPLKRKPELCLITSFKNCDVRNTIRPSLRQVFSLLMNEQSRSHRYYLKQLLASLPDLA